MEQLVTSLPWIGAGLALVFAVIWIAISMVHPAFELSNPLVVLLAFIILALAVFVLVLLLSRFNAYMRQFSADAVLVPVRAVLHACGRGEPGHPADRGGAGGPDCHVQPG